MRSIWEWLLDEKIVLSGMTIACLIAIMHLVRVKADKDIIMALVTLAGGFGGALTRGITHQPQQTDSTQTVSSTTTISPKEGVK